MKTILINGEENKVPNNIVSVEVSDASATDGGYYQVTFDIETISGKNQCVVCVQLCGTEYQSQMGCYLDGEYSLTEKVNYGWDGDEFISPFKYDSGNSEAYTQEIEEMDKFVETLQQIAIDLSETQAEIDIKMSIDKECETGLNETWEHFETIESNRHSATSTVEKVIEKSSKGRFRIIDDKISGFVQLNNYTEVPAPILIAFFDDKEELDDYLEANE